MLLCIGRLGSTDPTMHELAVRAPYRMSPGSPPAVVGAAWNASLILGRLTLALCRAPYRACMSFQTLPPEQLGGCSIKGKFRECSTVCPGCRISMWFALNRPLPDSSTGEFLSAVG